MIKPKPVLAKSGTWKAETENGKIVGYTGTFHKDDETIGIAAARHLLKSGIVGDDFTIEKNRNSSHQRVVISLRARDGHDLKKFEEFALKHNLIPNLVEKIEREGRIVMREEFNNDTLAFAPLTGKDAKALINSQHWQLEDTGYPSISKKGKPRGGYVVTTTTTPETAFQMAYYLEKKGYIPYKSFERINHEILHYRNSDEPLPEIRIAVSEEHFAKFAKKFPDAGSHPKPQVQNLLWSDAVQTASEHKSKSHTPAA